MVHVKRILNNPLYVLTAILSLLSGASLLIRFSDFAFAFIFYPSIILSAIIIFLTVACVKKGTLEKICRFLPALSIAFILLNRAGINGFAFFVLAVVTSACSLTLLLKEVKCKPTKTILGLFYLTLILPIMLVVILLLLPRPFRHNEVVQSAVSPNGRYKAEIWLNGQGALGGRTWIYMARQPDNINLFLVELHRRYPARVRIYDGRWGEFYDMTLYWEADNLLFVDFRTPLTFYFDGQEWISKDIEH